MHIRIICFLLLSFLFTPFYAYSQSSVSLDQAIQNSVQYLTSRIPKGTRAAVLSVKADSPELGEFTLKKISTALVNGNWFTVVERNAVALDSLSREMSYQMSGEVSDATSLSIGKQLGAQIIISGTLTRSDPNWRLEIQALQVETAQIAGQWSSELIRPDPVWTSLASSRSAAFSISGDSLTGRDKQTIIDGLRNALQTWKIALELDENTTSGYNFAITIYRSEMPPAPPVNMALLQAEVDVVFSRNGRVICKTGPYTITETTDALITRRVAEQLFRDQSFFTKVNEAIK